MGFKWTSSGECLWVSCVSLTGGGVYGPPSVVPRPLSSQADAQELPHPDRRVVYRRQGMMYHLCCDSADVSRGTLTRPLCILFSLPFLSLYYIVFLVSPCLGGVYFVFLSFPLSFLISHFLPHSLFSFLPHGILIFLLSFCLSYPPCYVCVNIILPLVL